MDVVMWLGVFSVTVGTLFLGLRFFPRRFSFLPIRWATWGVALANVLFGYFLFTVPLKPDAPEWAWLWPRTNGASMMILGVGLGILEIMGQRKN